ncbi:hypothetical protein, partial [Algoriphagus sp.]|uniref:hypothetical protein n=1 Tax=Algoriphagus sp. TaxID=1872435 RepID=UPI003F6E44FF
HDGPSIIFSTACVGLIPPLQGTLMSIRNDDSSYIFFAQLVAFLSVGRDGRRPILRLRSAQVT